MRPFSLHVAPLALTIALIALPSASATAQTIRTDMAPLPADVASQAVPFGEGAIADDALGTVAGREDTNQLSVANLNAGVSRNSVGDNSTTGDARISDNALQNLSGLSILNVNTGNNVAINAAMNVNISIAPQK